MEMLYAMDVDMSVDVLACGRHVSMRQCLRVYILAEVGRTC